MKKCLRCDDLEELPSGAVCPCVEVPGAREAFIRETAGLWESDDLFDEGTRVVVLFNDNQQQEPNI